MGYEEEHCSELYRKILDRSHRAMLSYMSDGNLERYQLAQQDELEEMSKLAPEDFGFSDGDMFIDVKVDRHEVYMIHMGKLIVLHTKNHWYPASNYTFQNILNLVLKKRMIRVREFKNESD